jgi:hypothetical protein
VHEYHDNWLLLRRGRSIDSLLLVCMSRRGLYSPRPFSHALCVLGGSTEVAPSPYCFVRSIDAWYAPRFLVVPPYLVCSLLFPRYAQRWSCSPISACPMCLSLSTFPGGNIALAVLTPAFLCGGCGCWLYIVLMQSLCTRTTLPPSTCVGSVRSLVCPTSLVFSSHASVVLFMRSASVRTGLNSWVFSFACPFVSRAGIDRSIVQHSPRISMMFAAASDTDGRSIYLLNN